MLIAVMKNTLNFIDISLSEPEVVGKYECESEIEKFALSWNDHHVLCILRSHPAIVLNIRNWNRIKIVQQLVAIDKIQVGEFMHKQRATLVLGTDLSILAMYDVPGKSLNKVCTVKGSIVDLALNSSDEKIAVACRDGKILIMLLKNFEYLFMYDVDGTIASVNFHPSFSNIFGVHDNDDHLLVYDINQTDMLTRQKYPGGIKAFNFVPNRTDILTLGKGNKCSLYDVTKEMFNYHLHLPQEPLSMSLCGNFFALGMDDGAIMLFNVDKMKSPLKSFHCFEANGSISACQFGHTYHIEDISDSEITSRISAPAGQQRKRKNSKSIRRKKNPIHLLMYTDDRDPVDHRKTSDDVIFHRPDDILAELKMSMISDIHALVQDVQVNFDKQIEMFKNYVITELTKLSAVNEMPWLNSISQSIDSSESFKSNDTTDSSSSYLPNRLTTVQEVAESLLTGPY